MRGVLKAWAGLPWRSRRIRPPVARVRLARRWMASRAARNAGEVEEAKEVKEVEESEGEIAAVGGGLVILPGAGSRFCVSTKEPLRRPDAERASDWAAVGSMEMAGRRRKSTVVLAITIFMMASP